MCSVSEFISGKNGAVSIKSFLSVFFFFFCLKVHTYVLLSKADKC